jgi:thiol-disulfide isomerase/thioredoxin
MNIPNTNTFFSKIQGNVSNYSSNTIFIIIGVIVFLVIGFSYYYVYLKPYMQATYRANDGVNEDPSNESTGATNTEILFFYADWCPHCKTAKPIWEAQRELFKNKTVNGHNVLFTDVNCTNESESTTKLMDKFNIEGFPTIKMIKDGQIIEFDAKPTKENLSQFLETVLK